MPGHKNKMPQPVKVKDSVYTGKKKFKMGKGGYIEEVQRKMMGGKVHDAKYYKHGGKVAGCGPARNKP